MSDFDELLLLTRLVLFLLISDVCDDQLNLIPTAETFKFKVNYSYGFLEIAAKFVAGFDELLSFAHLILFGSGRTFATTNKILSRVLRTLNARS